MVAGLTTPRPVPRSPSRRHRSSREDSPTSSSSSPTTSTSTSYLDPSRFPRSTRCSSRRAPRSRTTSSPTRCAARRARRSCAASTSHKHGVLEQPATVRRVREVPRQRRREVDDRDLDARRRLPHRAARQVPERVPGHRRRHVRPAGLGRVGQPDQRRQPVLGVQLPAQRERHARPVRRDAAGLPRSTSCRGSRASSSSRASDKPFFLYVAPYVPHLPGDPGAPVRRRVPGRAGAAHAVVQPGGREREPQWLRNRPLLNDQQIADDRPALYRKRLQSMLRRSRTSIEHVVDTLQTDRPARQHLHRLHLRQRLPPRPAPPAARAR